MPATSLGTGVAPRDPINREFFQKNISRPVFFSDTPISRTEPVRTLPQHLSRPLHLVVTKGSSSVVSLRSAVCTISPRLLGAAEPNVKPVNRLSRSSRPRRRGPSDRRGPRCSAGRGGGGINGGPREQTRSVCEIATLPSPSLISPPSGVHHAGPERYGARNVVRIDFDQRIS
jgi:hypothetical protein